LFYVLHDHRVNRSSIFRCVPLGRPNQGKGIPLQRARARAPGAKGGSDGLAAATAKGRCDRRKFPTSPHGRHGYGSFVVGLLARGGRKVYSWVYLMISVCPCICCSKNTPHKQKYMRRSLKILFANVCQCIGKFAAGPKKPQPYYLLPTSQIVLGLEVWYHTFDLNSPPQIEGKFTGTPRGLTNLFYGCID